MPVPHVVLGIGLAVLLGGFLGFMVYEEIQKYYQCENENTQYRGPPSKKKEKERKYGSGSCELCTWNDACVMFHPCRHTIYCRECADEYLHKNSLCPVIDCRQPIKRSHRY